MVAAFMAFMREANPWFALDRSSAEHVRATFLLAAAWYFLFALPLFLITPDRRGAGKPLTRAIRDGLRQLRDSIRQARRYRHIVRFLIARMIYIDGLATLFAFGGVYAAGVFDMAEQDVLTFGIMLNTVAGIGAAVFGWLDDRLGSRRVILLSLGGLILFGASILLVESPALFWGFGMLLSLFVGPLQAASRSYLARTAPEPLRNEAFGLYALSGKATAFLGPLMVGSLTSLADSQRVGMSIVVVFFLAGFLLMLKVPEANPG